MRREAFRSGQLEGLQRHRDHDRADDDAAFVHSLVGAIGKHREQGQLGAGNRPAEGLQEKDYGEIGTGADGQSVRNSKGD